MVVKEILIITLAIAGINFAVPSTSDFSISDKPLERKLPTLPQQPAPSRPEITPSNVDGRRKRSTKAQCVDTVFAEADKTTIVEEHNKYRKQETDDEGASGINMLEWDDGLAASAQYWAEQCQFRHDNLYNCSDDKDVGQNMAFRSPNLNFMADINDWYDEKLDYAYETMSCAGGKMCGHYTQVVWGTTRKVGCGWHFCDEMHFGSTLRRNMNVFVCNYYPAGNWVGVKTYPKNSQKCSDCSKVWISDDQPFDCADNSLCTEGTVVSNETCKYRLANGQFGSDSCTTTCDPGYCDTIGVKCDPSTEDCSTRCNKKWQVGKNTPGETQYCKDLIGYYGIDFCSHPWLIANCKEECKIQVCEKIE